MATTYSHCVVAVNVFTAQHDLCLAVSSFFETINLVQRNQNTAMNTYEFVGKFFFQYLQRIIDQTLPAAMVNRNVLLIRIEIANFRDVVRHVHAHRHVVDGS